MYEGLNYSIFTLAQWSLTRFENIPVTLQFMRFSYKKIQPLENSKIELCEDF